MNFNDLNPEILEKLEAYDEHEHVRRFQLSDDIIGFIAVHNTNLGPALGGCRMTTYADEGEAMHDVLRLSRGMTYKNAMAGLPLGGGKSVIIGNPFEQKTEAIMEAMGEAVESFGGAYVTAEDSGTGEEDMVAISRQTSHVTGLPPEMLEGNKYGELGGNPSPLTALGCYHGIRAAIKHRYNNQRDLSDMTVAIQGVGAVGLALGKLLAQDGAKIIAADINKDNLALAQKEISNIEIVKADEIFSVKADIFAPCAMGGALNDDTIDMLKVDIVAGAANNQLANEYHDKMLVKKDILYVPDYVINSGGVICVGYEYFRNSQFNPQDFDLERGSMVAHVEGIGKTVTDILTAAQERSLPTGETADQLAEEKFLSGKKLSDDNSNPEDSSNFGSNGGTQMVQ